MKDLEKSIQKILVERGWTDLRPGDIAKSISIESAELLEHFQWSNPGLAECKADKEKREKIANELADIFIYAIELSVLLGLNTEKVITNKIKQIRKKYPAARMRKASKAGDVSVYWEIKKKHRMKTGE